MTKKTGDDVVRVHGMNEVWWPGVVACKCRWKRAGKKFWAHVTRLKNRLILLRRTYGKSVHARLPTTHVSKLERNALTNGTRT